MDGMGLCLGLTKWNKQDCFLLLIMGQVGTGNNDETDGGFINRTPWISFGDRVTTQQYGTVAGRKIQA